jgi:hypothetical protein
MRRMALFATSEQLFFHGHGVQLCPSDGPSRYHHRMQVRPSINFWISLLQLSEIQLQQVHLLLEYTACSGEANNMPESLLHLLPSIVV